ncbi:hypothetical protein [Eisenibacter elegans]|uniref:hypothetical protein n=1 Tax=Eisenibacter elegans TaxID=997 RepID=UPI000410CDF9|nr:hypothetical protein [Eisenibacter elegans]
MISKKKPYFAISPELRQYLHQYGRTTDLPLRYDDLLRHQDSFPVLDAQGKDTLWETMIYPQYLIEELHKQLVTIYALLKTDGDLTVMEHLYIDRIDYCTFGNSFPFRIRVVNHYNDNYDHFYVKRADASRVYGLELEHILSPDRINFFVHQETLIEEHITGIPGDVFIKDYAQSPTLNRVRIAKEFVKFNERCYVKLLGDMRSYNYVIIITSDFEDQQYRVRAIDFDQQAYEGRRITYLPQFFKDNNPIVALCSKVINRKTLLQYQQEERTLMARRYRGAYERLNDLLVVMEQDTLSTPQKTEQLRQELADFYKESAFLQCEGMGAIVRKHLEYSFSGIKPLRV